MAWVSPTGYNDPDEAWSGEEAAYDDNTTTAASGFQSGPVAIPPGEWSDFLELTINAIDSNAVRFWANQSDNRWDLIDIDVYRDGGWVHVYEGAFTAKWIEKTFTAGSVDTIRVRIHVHIDWPNPSLCYLFEVDFWEVELPSLQAYSYIM